MFDVLIGIAIGLIFPIFFPTTFEKIKTKVMNVFKHCDHEGK